MHTFEVRYFVRGKAQPKVWQTYADMEEAQRDARLLLQMSNVERCQIFEWVDVASVYGRQYVEDVKKAA